MQSNLLEMHLIFALKGHEAHKVDNHDKILKHAATMQPLQRQMDVYLNLSL